MRKILDRLREPVMRTIDLDADERVSSHLSVLQDKPLLRQVFRNFHDRFNLLDEKFFASDGKRIELGAGVAPMRESYPSVLASDVVCAPHIDLVLNALHMNLPYQSVRVLFGQNCFHHFEEPELFFNDSMRVLQDGGGIILLEPYFGPFASFLYKRLFSSEGFDKHFESWNTPSSGPMNGANQALSYIIFVRDRKQFERKYPHLQIVHHEVCNNYLSYLCSGGLNFRQLVPNWAMPFIRLFELLLWPFRHFLALHHIFVLKKAPVATA